jgi:hypothetical protein
MGIMNISETILAPRNLMAEANQITQELDGLKYYLKKLDSWPAAGDEFLTLLPKTDDPEPLTEKERAWLLQVVDASIEGTDIGFRYPAFFQKLLMNSTLRQAFMDSLKQEMTLRNLI